MRKVGKKSQFLFHFASLKSACTACTINVNMEYNIYPSNIEIESHNTIAVTLQKKLGGKRQIDLDYTSRRM